MDKRKVGIMTFQGSNNCGSLLQAYALQVYLENDLNYETEIINFSNKNQKDMYSIFSKNKNIKSVVKNILCLPYYHLLKAHYENYAVFVKEYLKLSPQSYEDYKEMDSVEDNFDLIVAGSDQIWNIKCYDADDAYFLNFVKNKPKIAYAPSLGAVDLNKYANDPSKYEKLVNEFDYLSVRERNGKKWLEELTKRDVKILPDPTLLIPKEQWEKIIGNRIIEGDYIFYYAFNYPKDYSKILKKLSETLKIQIIMMDAKPWLLRGPKLFGFNITDSSGPLIFLNLMKNAKYVITTSLHGTIFSAIFEKNFWYLKGVLYNQDDDRASFLLEQLELQSRLIEVDKIDIHNIDTIPNYSNTRSKITELKNEANKFWNSIDKEMF